MVEQIDAVRRSLGLAAEASGSNNWAVSGARSATGTPLIAGDPHLPPSMPGIWYEVSLRHGDRFVRGASLPGMPGIYMGQNNDVCWTITNVMADVQDLFVERIEGEQLPVRRRVAAAARSCARRSSSRAAPSRSCSRSASTHHGPIVNEALGADDGEPLALRLADARRTDRLRRRSSSCSTSPPARSWWRKLEGHTSPASNMVWADRHGSIGYKLIGRLPMRRGGCPDLPKPGWTGEFEWEGTVPYEELPEVVDPESGYLITANNRIVGDEYPHHITSDWLDGFRAKRIEEMLEATEKHDLDELRGDPERQPLAARARGGAPARPPAPARPARAQRDRAAAQLGRPPRPGHDRRHDLPGLPAAAGARSRPRARSATATSASAGSTAPTTASCPHVTSPWRWHSHLMSLWEEADEELIGRPWDELVLEALAGALDDLGERFGPDPEAWRWGRVHELKFPHPLGDANPLFDRLLNRRLRAGGAQETVSQIAYDPNDPYNAVWAPSWRMIADPTDPDRSRWQTFTGQSGHPASPHYDDLQVDWLEGRTQPMCGEGPWSELELVPSA